VWKQAADDDLGFTVATGPWAMPIDGYRPAPAVAVTWAVPTIPSFTVRGPATTIAGSPLLIGDTWLASTHGTPVPRPLGPVLLPVGVREGYVLIAGDPYQLQYDHLARVPRFLGQIAIADARVVVITGDEGRVVWVSRDGGPLRGYSLNRCLFR
jgi:hypothetical protein